MKKFFLVIAGVTLLLTAISFATLFVAPGAGLSLIQTATAWNSGLERKTINLDGYIAHYYEGGAENAQTVVLLHGLIDNKNSFVSATSELTKTYRVILPDLQGHGENAQKDGRDYSIGGQAAFVEDVLSALDIERLVIGGNSMGGHVATALAVANQDRIESLIILNATGMTLDEPPTYYQYPENIDVEYMTEMYANAFKDPPSVPSPIMGYLAQDLNAKAAFYNDVVQAVTSGESFRLDEAVTKLSVPTLIIWGSDDKIVPLKYADAYHAAIPHSKLRILDVGHAPQMETPNLVEREILEFLSQAIPAS